MPQEIVTPPVTAPPAVAAPPAAIEPPALELPDEPAAAPAAPAIVETAKALTQTDVDAAIEAARAKWQADSELSEIEKYKQDLADRDARLAETEKIIAEGKLTKEFESAASQEGATKADRLLKFYREDLKVSAAGKIENLAEILAKGKTEFPEFFPKLESIDAGAGGKEATLTAAQKIEAEFEKTGRKSAFRL